MTRFRGRPRLLRRRIKTPFYYWGFQCGVGWRSILETLFQRVEQRCGELDLPDRNYPAVAQIKEKFGTLNVYFHFGRTRRLTYRDLADLIQAAGEAPMVTCETCGKPGEWHNEGWWRVRCADFEAARNP